MRTEVGEEEITNAELALLHSKLMTSLLAKLTSIVTVVSMHSAFALRVRLVRVLVVDLGAVSPQVSSASCSPSP